jgi:RimJ/RimL family protein N-acetyltransferase
MDSHFGLECAGRRYAYWAEDVLADGATLLLMKYKEKVISFDILVGRDNETVDAILGGLLPEFEASGLGFVGLYLISQWAKGENYKKIVTNVSSNNLPILRLHELFGYGVDDLAYVLTKYL